MCLLHVVSCSIKTYSLFYFKNVFNSFVFERTEPYIFSFHLYAVFYFKSCRFNKKSNISFKFGKQHLVSFMFYMHLRLIRRGPLGIVPTQNIQSVVLKSSSMDVHLCKLLDLDSISNSSASVINLFHKT